MSDGLARSQALHLRVRRFGLECLRLGTAGDSFEQLALEIADYQRSYNPVLARLAAAARSDRSVRQLEQIPVVPADAFRLGRVASFEPSADVARFETSGTTGRAGVHAFRTLDTYRELSLAWGKQRLLAGAAPSAQVTALALAAPFEPQRRSSLGYMMQEFMREFDARALGGGAAFDPLEPGRWLLAPGALDLVALERGAELAGRRGEPLLLLATSFALGWLLEALQGARLPLPPGSVVMHTGGFKGHAQQLNAAELGAAASHALGVPSQRLIGEYGMTELSSQLYDGGFAQGPEGQSVFVEPPWLRVTAVDPITLAPVPEGAVGLACFTDLANIDSALVVLTQDEVRRVAGGLVLLGRRRGARVRGCSLAVEALAATPLEGPRALRGARP
jgi:hypothetical protein